MNDTVENSSTTPESEIRIVGLNTDKTRRTLGSTTVYQVYFELTAQPPSAWRNIFGGKWKEVNPAQEAGLDGKFLVIHCPLQDVATTHLPALKKAVEATNIEYKQYILEQRTEEERRSDVWNDERKTVEEMAKKLQFE